MCLGVPGLIQSIENEDGNPLKRTARVSFGGVIKEVNLAYVPEARVGDYVIVHVGFAISRIDGEEAEKVFSYLKEIDDIPSFPAEVSGESIGNDGSPIKSLGDDVKNERQAVPS
jgi:hydrogenase expression/formation protein HypC